MKSTIQQARSGKKYFKTIYGNWVKVLWVGLGSIRIAYLDFKGIETTAISQNEFTTIIA